MRAHATHADREVVVGAVGVVEVVATRAPPHPGVFGSLGGSLGQQRTGQ
jgi:hypothetical protein